MLNRSVDDDAHTVDDWFLRTVDRRWGRIPKGARVEPKRKVIYIWHSHYKYRNRNDTSEKYVVRWKEEWLMGPSAAYYRMRKAGR